MYEIIRELSLNMMTGGEKDSNLQVPGEILYKGVLEGPRGTMNGAVEFESVWTVEGEETIFGCELLVWG